MYRASSKFLAIALLGIMAVLMFGAARQDSATVDEATHLAVGYIYWKGLPTRMGAEEHPPLGQLVETSPLLFMDVKFSDIAQGMLRGELGYPWTVSWKERIRPVRDLLAPGCEGRYVQIPPLGDALVQWHCPSSYPIDNWYYQARPEGQLFAKVFVYDGTNDGDAMVFAGRLVQIAVALLTGILIFFWTRRAVNHDGAALVALALWAFNPTVLGYGHLLNTDNGVTLGMTLAVYLFARFLERPSLKGAALAGVATGVALTVKFTALILAPIFVFMLAICWRKIKPSAKELCKMGGVLLLAAWIVILIVFASHCAPAPPPSETDQAVFEIPAWFRNFRPLLIPSGFFKGIAIALGHSKGGTESYLMGQWSKGGWWYYFPLAFVLKEPVSYVIFVASGLFLFVKQFKSTRWLEQAAWLGAGVYLLCAMSSGINIGVRHLMPMLPLLSVGIGCTVSRLINRQVQYTVKALVVWLIISALVAYPLYIQFFSEVVGGAGNGYKYLIDSNYDWGQDANRLKTFLEEHQIRHIYLDYYGNQFSIEHLKISNTRVSAELAKQIQQGTLVVSASQLMQPEWAWLRESRQPSARVAHTLFVYSFP